MQIENFSEKVTFGKFSTECEKVFWNWGEAETRGKCIIASGGWTPLHANRGKNGRKEEKRKTEDDDTGLDDGSELQQVEGENRKQRTKKKKKIQLNPIERVMIYYWIVYYVVNVSLVDNKINWFKLIDWTRKAFPKCVPECKVLYTCSSYLPIVAWAETWRRLWGNGNFRMTFLKEKKFHFPAQNFLWPFSHRLYFVSEIWYVTYMTPLFLTKNLNFRQKYPSLTPFFSQFVLCLTSDYSTSQIIGGRMHGPSTPPQFFWRWASPSPL